MPTEAGKAFVSVEYDPRSLTRLEATTRRQGSSIAGMWGSAAKRAGRVLALGLGAGTIAAGIGLTKAVKSAASFQTELNVMESVSGATGDQMQRISRLAIALGKDIHLPATSAQDAATAMTELAKGGLDVEQSMRAARGTLELAAAGQVDVATAAGISANALNAFALGGSAAGHVADLLAGAANASTGEISDFAQGLQYAGTAAHAAGQDIDLTVAALAEMANAGLSGSVAGSSLAASLRALQAPSAKASAVIKKFGLDVYDAQGNMKPLDEIAQTFTDHLGDMTQKQQNQTLATIFGSRAVQAARVVFLGGRDALDKYRDRVSRTGNAQRLAAARTKGFGGALQALESNAETLGIQIGLRLLPVLTNAARRLSDFIDFLGKLADAPNVSVAVRIAVQGAADIGRSLRDVLFGHGARIKPIRIPAGKVIDIQRDPGSSGLVGKLTAALTGANWAPVGHAIGTAIGASITFTSKAAQSLAQSFIDNRMLFAQAGILLAAALVQTLLDPGFYLDHWRTVLSIGLSIIPIGKFGIAGKEIGGALTRPVLRLLLRLFGRLPGVAQDALIAIEVLFRGGFRRIASGILGRLTGAASAVPNRFQTALGVVWRIASRVFGQIASYLRGRIGAAIGSIGDRVQKSIIGRMVTWFSKLTLIQLAVSTVAGIFDRIKSAVQWLIDHIPDIHFPSIPGGSLFSKLTASGGVVTSAQARIVGEAGPEAIIPLDRLPDIIGQVSVPGHGGSFALRGRMAITNWRDGMAEVDLRISDHVDLAGAHA